MLGDPAIGRRRLEVRILGPLEVWAEGRQVELGTGRQRSLLALLVLHRGEVLSTDRLIDELWAGEAPATAAKVLQNLVSQLRRSLGEGAIVTRPPGYVLQLADEDLDAARFERFAAEGREALDGDPKKAGERLREALALWRGEPLAEFAYDEFARNEIGRLEELRLGALEDRIDADLALGAGAALVPELESLVEEHRLRERLRGQQMIALYRAGRQADALEAYAGARAVLQDELGLEPSRALKDLQQAILAQDPVLGKPSRLPALPARRRRRIVVVAVAAVVPAVVAGALVLALSGDSSVTVLPESVVEVDVGKNEVVDSIDVGGQPGQIRVLDGSVFVTSIVDKTLSRIDADSGEVVTSGEHAAGTGLAVAGEQIWVASESRSEITRVSPRTLGAITKLDLGVDPGSFLVAMPALGGGSLWVSEVAPSAITRWSLSTRRLQRRYEFQPLEFPVEPTFGDGALWVALHETHELLRIDAATGATSRVAVGRYPTNPVLGLGSVWVSSTGEGTVWRIHPVTERVEGVIEVGDAAFGIAVGGGSVWVSDYCRRAVARIDPATNAVVARIPIGYFPRWLAFGADRLWVSVSAEDPFDFSEVCAAPS
jgi:DNA-binding SARP family transcriptional activator/streptogramin lyase